MRQLVSAAKIMALVSLVIGGVILSSASIIVAVVAYRRILQSSNLDDGMRLSDLKRSAIAAIVVSVLALALNTAALAVIYPMVIEMLESGDYASLWGSSAPSTGSGGSFWG